MIWSTIALLGVLWASPATANDSTLEELDGHLRVAVRRLEGENRLVLVGFTPDRLLAEKTILPAEHGFKPVNFKNEQGLMTPKYLFSANRHGIQTVYSMDLHQSWLSLKLLSDSTSMPPVLVDAEMNKVKAVLHRTDGTIIDVAKKILRIPLKGALYPFRQAVRLREYNRMEQAAGLNYLFYQAYAHCRFPSLVAPEGDCLAEVGPLPGVFTHADVAPIGDALKYRYKFGLQQQIASEAIGLFGVKSEDMTYEEMLGRMKDISTGMMSVALGNLNSIGLHLIPISDTAGIILYDRERLPGKAWVSRRMEGDRPEDLEDRLSDLEKRGPGTLVPWATVTFNHGNPVISLVDFASPNRQRNRALAFEILKTIESVLGLLFVPASRAIDEGSDTIDYMLIKSGSTVHKRADRREACEELKIGIAAGVARIESHGRLDVEAAISYIRDIHLFSEAEIEEFRARLVSTDQNVFGLAVRELLGQFANFACGVRGISGGAGEINRVSRARETRWERIGNHIEEDPKDLDKKLSDRDRRLDQKEARKKENDAKRKREEDAKKGRSPQSDQSQVFNPPSQQNFHPDQRPVILFMVDGMRPDALRAAVQKGYAPNIGKLFLETGFELESYTSHSVTLPSWSTILSGMESDRHGLKGTSNASRDPTVAIDNLLDIRHDMKYYYYGSNPESRGLMRVHSSGTKVLQDYLPADESLASFAPIHGQQFLPLVGLKARAKVAALLAAKGSLNGSRELDLATANDVSSAIDCNREGVGPSCAALFDFGKVEDKNEMMVDANYAPGAKSRRLGSYRLVTAWFAGIDHTIHEAPSEFPVAMRAIDRGIGEIMAAAAKHPTLKDAVVILVSDHGMAGGDVMENGYPGGPFVAAKNAPVRFPPEEGSGITIPPESQWLKPTDVVHNTAFKILDFFTGGHVGFTEFPFVVGSHKIDKPFLSGKYDILYKIMPPFSYTWRGVQNREAPDTLNVHGRSIIVEPYGDSLTHVLLTLDRKLNTDPLRRRSYRELRKYPNPEGGTIDVPGALLSVQENGIMPGSGLLDKDNVTIPPRMHAIHGLRPIGHYAMALEGNEALAWAKSLVPADPLPGEYRPPVLIQAFGPRGPRSAIVLTRDVGEETFFRYLVVSHFDQGEVGFTGNLTRDPSWDPLGYNLDGYTPDPAAWKTDREWLALLHDHWYPTGIFSITRNLTLAAKYGFGANGETLYQEGDQIIDQSSGFFKLIKGFFRLQEFRPKMQHVKRSVRDIAQAELPDFILYASTGFTFNPYQAHSGDHGGLGREHVRNALFIHDPQVQRPAGAPRLLPEPVLSRDVTATILDYLKIPNQVHGKSFRALLPK